MLLKMDSVKLVCLVRKRNVQKHGQSLKKHSRKKKSLKV